MNNMTESVQKSNLIVTPELIAVIAPLLVDELSVIGPTTNDAFGDRAAEDFGSQQRLRIDRRGLRVWIHRSRRQTVGKRSANIDPKMPNVRAHCSIAALTSF
jgi:hypothetical protein